MVSIHVYVGTFAIAVSKQSRDKARTRQETLCDDNKSNDEVKNSNNDDNESNDDDDDIKSNDDDDDNKNNDDNDNKSNARAPACPASAQARPAQGERSAGGSRC